MFLKQPRASSRKRPNSIPQALKPDSILADLDIQSLELAEIIFELEEEFDIEIELNAAAAWERLKTVGDVAAAVGELAGQGA